MLRMNATYSITSAGRCRKRRLLCHDRDSESLLVGRFENYEIGNVANHIYNEFVYPRLDDERLELAINRLIALCPVLRTVYDAESMTQRFISVSQAGHYALAVNDLRLDDEATALARARKRLSHQVYQVDRFPLFTFEISRLRDRDVLHIVSI